MEPFAKGLPVPLGVIITSTIALLIGQCTGVKVPRGSTDQLRTMVCTQHDGMPWCTHSNMVIGMYTRVLEYVGGPLCGVRSDIFKPQLFERHLYCCVGVARSSL